MANLKAHLFLAVLITASLSACGLILPKQILEQPAKQQALISPLQGRVTLLDGTPLDLATENSKIQIVMFVSDGCAVCRQETKDLVTDLKTRGQPSNVHLYSVLIGATPEDARDWRDELGVDWTTGINPGDELFREYCRPALLTPCVILKKPTESGTTRLFGKHSVVEWETIAGRWSH